MKVEVRMTPEGADEQQALELYRTDLEAAGGQAVSGVAEFYEGRISQEVAARVERIRQGRIAAQSDLGAVFVQLPAEDQAALKGDLLRRAEAAGIDTAGVA